MTGWVQQLADGALLHVAFLTVAVAFLVRDVLWLRCLSIVAYTIFMAVAAGQRPEAPSSLLLWYAGFIAINLGHAGWLICERATCRLTAEERRLRTLAFPALDQLTVKRLFRQGDWQTLEPGVRLTRSGSVPDRIYLVLEGRVDVFRDRRAVATVGAGHFVGEMAFVTRDSASADAIAGESVRVFVWNRGDLERAFERRPELREALYSAIGPDLARKIARTSAQLQTVSADVGVHRSADAAFAEPRARSTRAG